MRIKILTLGLICFFIFTHCKKELPTTPDIPGSDSSLSIEYFYASPTEIDPGGSSTLSWLVKNATQVEIDHGIGIVSATGTTEASPEYTTMYILTATKDNEKLTKAATVTVYIPRAKLVLTNPGVSFSADFGAGVGRFSCWGTIENTGDATAINIGIWVYIRDNEGIPLGWGGTFPISERLEKDDSMKFYFARTSAGLLDIVAFADKEQTIKYMKVSFETE